MECCGTIPSTPSHCACQLEANLKQCDSGETIRGKRMVKALEENHGATGEAKVRRRDYRKSMSDHVATALLVYTGLQIFATVHAMREGMNSIAPYVILVVLVAGIIPFCHKYEQRWTSLPAERASDPEMAAPFKRDVLFLWALALIVPIGLTSFFTLIFT